jgi:hypothetical protein
MRAPHAILGYLLLLATLASGCSDHRATAEVGALPVAPTAYPTGPASVGPGVAGISEDIQALTVRIEDGRFGSDVYDMQLRPVRIEVWSSGGPFTIAIDGLVNAHPLDADGTTVIGLSPPSSGRYTMRLGGANTDTATLNVRAAGD